MAHAAQKALAPAAKAKTFVALVSNKKGSAVHLVKTYDHTERPCWFLLKADVRSVVKLEQTAYEQMVDLRQFGEVVASGWGHTPDEVALEKFIYSET